MKDAKSPFWAPYTQNISIKDKTKGILHVEYNGGEADVILENTIAIMLYGSIPPLEEELLLLTSKYNVPIVMHNRNVTRCIYIHSGLKRSNVDTLTNQILCREDLRKCKYIARTILEAKFKGMNPMVGLDTPPLQATLSIKNLRNIEAVYSKVFWKRYYSALGHPDYFRRSKNDISAALDACSKFLSGIILRWVDYHNLSPFHGFLHEQTSYPALVYDLIEPYRYILAQAILNAMQANAPMDKLLAISIDELKNLLHEEIYCPQTRQYVRRQELLHGICLALRAYFLGLGDRFVIPMEGQKNGGRPMKTNYTLPGKSAGYSKIVRIV